MCRIAWHAKARLICNIRRVSSLNRGVVSSFIQFGSLLSSSEVPVLLAAYGITDDVYMKKNKINPQIEITEARAALGMIERNYTDSDIEQMIGIMLSAAEFAYENYASGSSET